MLQQWQANICEIGAVTLQHPNMKRPLKTERRWKRDTKTHQCTPWELGTLEMDEKILTFFLKILLWKGLLWSLLFTFENRIFSQLFDRIRMLSFEPQSWQRLQLSSWTSIWANISSYCVLQRGPSSYNMAHWTNDCTVFDSFCSSVGGSCGWGGSTGVFCWDCHHDPAPSMVDIVNGYFPHAWQRETHTATHRCAHMLESVYTTQAITFVVDLIVVQNRHCQMEQDGNTKVFITMMRFSDITCRHTEKERIACGTEFR